MGINVKLLLNNKLQEPPNVNHFGLFQLLGTPYLRISGVKHTFRRTIKTIKRKSGIARAFLTEFLLAVRTCAQNFTVFDV